MRLFNRFNKPGCDFPFQEGKILLGHQDALAYGVHHKEWEPFTTDMYRVAGVHPAVFGWDLGKLGQFGNNLDGVSFGHMINWIKGVHLRGGINTFSWHMDNLVTGGDSWDKKGNVVRSILPGGSHHELYRRKLDVLASFLFQLRTEVGWLRPVPIIFRPFHEHTGSWFWWGAPHTQKTDYIELWRFTWHYLVDVHRINHLCWAYAPDASGRAGKYFDYYPGDAYVDIFGLDDYQSFKLGSSTRGLIQQLRELVLQAEEKGKIAALTETGLEGVNRSKWYTRHLMQVLLHDEVVSRIKYVLLWRNHSTTHHYGPYPGHAANADFQQFVQHPQIGTLPKQDLISWNSNQAIV